MNVALPVYVSVLMPKFGSIETFGRGPETPASLNTPSATVMRVGIGPPAPCVIEYIFHPPPMLADTRAVPRPPAGTDDGETEIESETGFWPNAVMHDPKVTHIKKKYLKAAIFNTAKFRDEDLLAFKLTT